MREILISECIELLRAHKFIVSKPLGRSCFDMVASKEDIRLILKILKNIDSLSKDQSKELKKISKILHGTPLIIGIRTRNAPMEHGVVYDRYNIKAVTFETFRDYLEGSPPMVYANRGGFFVKIDGNVLKEVRESMGISVGKLAEVAGVSRKAIYKYETQMANPSVDVAIKIEEFLDVPLVRGIDLFEPVEDEDVENKLENLEDFKKEAINFLNDLGFKSFVVEKAPFDAVAEKDTEKDMNILLTNIEEKSSEEVKRKALFVRELSKMLDGYSLLILEEKEKEYKNLPVISLNELKKMDDALELIEHIKSMLKSF
ncbi:MAG: transcriptional regulator [Methanococci archaeon]|uniref:Putative HTH-type transcriptional regulatory protein Metvu_0804 n=1 Tax=Methanocaldococcus vulcanius (strain ATCC 700851 / DSM 12094 / M7) TaxID=579137 RepID=C9RGG0_METVM|nr:transcriptional regulator [Methanocaldococcus vulcanius]ACX72662.1 transcriptional regulator, XRE family [Methanocaldococcus vulcanius M7]NPA63244.1 transcriptional regulator [Methanococci archaeon]